MEEHNLVHLWLLSRSGILMSRVVCSFVCVFLRMQCVCFLCVRMFVCVLRFDVPRLTGCLAMRRSHLSRFRKIRFTSEHFLHLIFIVADVALHNVHARPQQTFEGFHVEDCRRRACACVFHWWC